GSAGLQPAPITQTAIAIPPQLTPLSHPFIIPHYPLPFLAAKPPPLHPFICHHSSSPAAGGVRGNAPKYTSPGQGAKRRRPGLPAPKTSRAEGPQHIPPPRPNLPTIHTYLGAVNKRHRYTTTSPRGRIQSGAPKKRPARRASPTLPHT